MNEMREKLMEEKRESPAPPPGPPIRHIEEGVRILPPGEVPTPSRRGPSWGENAVKFILGFVTTLALIGMVFWAGGYNFERGFLTAFLLASSLMVACVIGAAFTD